MSNRYLVVIEKGDQNYSAFSPDVPGCIATGKTIESAIDSMRSALEFHIEGMVEGGEAVPQPKPLGHYVKQVEQVIGEDIIAHVIVDTPEMAFV
ncbi:MAG: type II toxin-antitoxin system HicB family antitoxin [Pyrinomonadaceae bacterium]